MSNNGYLYGSDPYLRPNFVQQHEAVPPDPSKQKQQETKKIFKQFADRTSLQGIPYVKHSKSTPVKVLWLLFFLGATAGCVVQLHSLSITFFKRETTTSINLGYSQLPFPTVTFCNNNPIRSSARPLSSAAIESIIDDYAPAVNFTDDTRRRRRRSTNPTRKKRDLNFGFEEEDYDENETDYYGYSSDDYGSGNRSDADLVRSSFQYEMGQLDGDYREEIGHQSNMLIQECVFNGLLCGDDDFELYQSTTYGNCYVFNSADRSTRNNTLRTKRSGSHYGLELTLYTEKREYIETLTDGGVGIRMDIHPYRTFPHISSHGISLAPGTQTYVGMKMLNISRMSPPYGDCSTTESKAFFERYDKIYNIESCNSTCQDTLISTRCQCYQSENREYYTDFEIRTMDPCSSTHQDCAQEIINSLGRGNLSCGCSVPCKETVHDLQISQSQWPHGGFWHDYVQGVCDSEGAGAETNPDSQCSWLRTTPEGDEERVLQANFLNVNIYYRDLNFENIVEKASYEFNQYISDCGGSLGLWIGASVLTVLEIFDFLFQYVALLCRRSHRKQTSKHGSGKSGPRHTSSRNGGKGSVPSREGTQALQGYNGFRY